jgi:hypothetical protein
MINKIKEKEKYISNQEKLKKKNKTKKINKKICSFFI